MLCLLFLFHLIYGVFTYHQNDYRVIPERFESAPNLKYLNLSYIHFKYNRTYHAVNVTAYLKMEFGNRVTFVAQGYRFASNEYRLFPIQFDDNLCRCLKTNLYGVQNIYQCGYGFYCPLAKGWFHICNWQPDYTQFPPYIPSGRYKLNLNYFYHGEQILSVDWFGTVERDIV